MQITEAYNGKDGRVAIALGNILAWRCGPIPQGYTSHEDALIAIRRSFPKCELREVDGARAAEYMRAVGNIVQGFFYN